MVGAAHRLIDVVADKGKTGKVAGSVTSVG